MGLFTKKLEIPTAEAALPGRTQEMPVPDQHFVSGHPLKEPYPEHLEMAMFGMGCFWGAERASGNRTGVIATAGRVRRRLTPNPTYEEVCSG